MRPIIVVKGKGFRKIMKILEPEYKVPDCKTITAALKIKHDRLKEKVMAEIVCSEAVSFTTNLWTSLQMEAYMTVIVHFIDEEWGMKSVVLEMKHMPEMH